MNMWITQRDRNLKSRVSGYISSSEISLPQPFARCTRSWFAASDHTLNINCGYKLQFNPLCSSSTSNNLHKTLDLRSRKENYNVNQHTFVDRFFHSCHELMDLRQSGNRDINTLYTFLSMLHSLNDRLKADFNINSLSQYAEFRFLRLIRNYFHHVGDVDEYRLFQTRSEIISSHMEMIIIPAALVARSVINFRDNQRNIKNSENVKREFSSIAQKINDFSYICENAASIANNFPFKIKGNDYYIGFDIYKSVYNISNIIADLCKSIEEIAYKNCIVELDDSFTELNNIEREDLVFLPGKTPILTTEGYIFIE